MVKNEPEPSTDKINFELPGSFISTPLIDEEGNRAKILLLEAACDHNNKRPQLMDQKYEIYEYFSKEYERKHKLHWFPKIKKIIFYGRDKDIKVARSPETRVNKFYGLKYIPGFIVDILREDISLKDELSKKIYGIERLDTSFNRIDKMVETGKTEDLLRIIKGEFNKRFTKLRFRLLEFIAQETIRHYSERINLDYNYNFIFNGYSREIDLIGLYNRPESYMKLINNLERSDFLISTKDRIKTGEEYINTTRNKIPVPPINGKK